MPNKMLIDSSHPEETRVVVVRGSQVEEFDFEAANRKQLRGNIYLAKVTRVEPSLQAAFVDYGGNRHGFLAFSEIHPDYYQIPVADRQALIEAEEAEAVEEERIATAEAEARDAKADLPPETAVEGENRPAMAVMHDSESVSGEMEEARGEDEPRGESDARSREERQADEEGHSDEDGNGDEVRHSDEEGSEDHVESVGAEDALEEVPERRKPRARQYKIQEVIKRRQVLLIQVVKEERSNKGAALTTYLSLAGRYSVLMPNTARGGGISRKITSLTDRKRLKQVAADLEVPEGMGVILRTAGASRTKAEVKRDFEYLLRLWENVRELTLRSTAPSLVYEEGSLVKRSIRDLYNKDIDEVLVAGEDAYREAKDFMRMLMPSHAKSVQPYRESQPLFTRYGVEAQLDAMFSPQVTLRSGGYIVINQTEALVAIDVNSGRSTREHNIEDTAHQTNLEAADEVARQLRLRDLAGLIVIDFIDMEENRNNRAVERRLKDALKDDRARIQVGRISHFGLMEMSRQRIRTGVVESTTELCPHCHGTGHLRSPSSVALHVLRAIEDQLLKGATHDLIVRTKTAAALYILNQKRAHLSELERRFGLSINILADDALAGGSHFTTERGEPVTARPEASAVLTPDSVRPLEIIEEVEEESAAEEDEPIEDTGAANEDREFEDERASEDGQANGGERRRRRRRRRRGEGREENAAVQSQPPQGARAARRDEQEGAQEEQQEEQESQELEAGPSEESDGERPGQPQPGEGGRRRRRGRRGGRRGGRGSQNEAGGDAARPVTAAAAALDDEWPELSAPGEYVIDRADAASAEKRSAEPAFEQETRPHNGEEAPSAARLDADEAPKMEQAPTPAASTQEDESGQKRAGWWQRRGFF